MAEIEYIMPQCPDIEEAIIGVCVTHADAMEYCAGIIKPHHFYSEANRVIFEAALTLLNNRRPIDALTLINQLQVAGKIDAAGGKMAIVKIISRVSSSAHLEFHCHIMIEKWMKREQISIGQQMISRAYDDSQDPFEVRDSILKQVNSLDSDSGMTVRSAKDLLGEVVAKVVKVSENPEVVAGIDTGFKVQNRLTHGWQESDLVILAARPGMGKTALAVSYAINLDKTNVPCAIFSLEMSQSQIAYRMLSSITGIDSDRLKSGHLNDPEWVTLHNHSTKLGNIWIDDTPGISIYDLCRRVKKLVKDKGVKIVFIDYLQLMKGEKTGNREQEISGISRSLKILAKDLKITVVALAQLSRAVEQRADKRPMLSDLRESGSIEQDADIVGFLYRDSYYASDGSTTAELDFAKHRNGAPATIQLYFNGPLTLFTDEA